MSRALRIGETQGTNPEYQGRGEGGGGAKEGLVSVSTE
jgi:hypothetical protein